MPSPAMVARPFPLCTGIATVAAREEITPRMARFTLTAPPFAELGVEEPGEIITLGWSDDGGELVLPEQGWRFRGREQHWRNFTVRAYRPEPAEIDVDFFLHGDVGRASAWAIRATPGDTLGYAGPRIWGGGEALAMRGVRDALLAAGVPRSAMDVLGDWKHRSTPEDVEY